MTFDEFLLKHGFIPDGAGERKRLKEFFDAGHTEGYTRGAAGFNRNQLALNIYERAIVMRGGSEDPRRTMTDAIDLANHALAVLAEHEQTK